MPHFDVCVIGHVVRDINTVGGRQRPPQPGGTAYYASMVYHSLGLRTATVTTVAAEDDALLAQMRAAGITIFNSPGAVTTAFHNDYAPDNPDLRTQRVSAHAEPLHMMRMDTFPEAEIYHLGPLIDGDIDVSIARACADRAALVAADAQGWVRCVEDGAVEAVRGADAAAQLAYINVLKADLDEILSLTGKSNLADAVGDLTSTDLSDVVVTMASRGSAVFGRGRMVAFDAVPPRAVRDATGCGDTYLAAYLQRRRGSDQLETCAAFASVAASMNIECHGPLTASSKEVAARWRDYRNQPNLRVPIGLRSALSKDAA